MRVARSFGRAACDRAGRIRAMRGVTRQLIDYYLMLTGDIGDFRSHGCAVGIARAALFSLAGRDQRTMMDHVEI